MSNDTLETSEQSDLLSTLAQHRQFLRFTARDLDDEQATRRTTVSELTIAGLIKHVAATGGALGRASSWLGPRPPTTSTR